MSQARIGIICAISFAVCGCASLTAPAPQPSMVNVNTAKSMSAPAKVGAFKLAAGLSPGVDLSISVRGSNTMSAPAGSGFSGYLRDVLMTELRAANRLDEASSVVISGELTRSELDAGISTGTAGVGAHFVVTRAGAVCFDKELVATSQWDSSFMGAVAIPSAFNHYSALYPDLAGKLLSDTDFRQHCLPGQ